MNIADHDRCPECGEQWAYQGSDGRTYSHIIGRVSRDLDLTVAWQCPMCGTRWDRDADVEVRA